MGLSIASLHQPLNDFFLEQFGGEADDQVVFRFEKFGSVISDDDFIDAGHPELGVVAALAVERFSDLVNRVPVDDGDGINVVSSAASIDDTYYYHLLSAAVPDVADDTSEEDTAAIRASFNEMKADAMQLWDEAELASLSGLALAFKPAYATPEDWYRSDAAGSWTARNLTVTGESEATNGGAEPDTRLFRLRPADHDLAEALAVEVPEEGVAIDLKHTASALRDRPFLVRRAQRITRAKPRSRLSSVIPRLRRDVVMDVRVARVDGPLVTLADPAPAPIRLVDTVRFQLRDLEVRDRVVLNTVIAQAEPTEPVHTNEIHIGFEHCLVQISRPWLLDAFIHHRSWRVPGVEPGSVSAPDQPGGLAWLPVAAVVVRKLEITADWAGEDVEKAGEVTAFGPFSVTGDAVSGQLSHPGTQVIGWLLQRMPALPPR